MSVALPTVVGENKEKKRRTRRRRERGSNMDCGKQGQRVLLREINLRTVRSLCCELSGTTPYHRQREKE